MDGPGRPLKEVADFLGHADIRMVERHYGHLDPSYKRAAVAVLNEALPDAETPQYHRKWEGLRDWPPRSHWNP
jgi:hypothetical protein